MHKIGIIPFDVKDEAIAVLFVTSHTRGRWILPKGQAEEGETAPETGAREGFEEAGVKGIVLEDYPMTVSVTSTNQGDKNAVPVTYFPLLVTEQLDEWPESDSRQRHWALLPDASKVTLREDFRPLVKQFEALAPSIRKAVADHKS